MLIKLHHVIYRIFTDGRFWFCQELSNGRVLFRSDTKEKCEFFLNAYDKGLNVYGELY